MDHTVHNKLVSFIWSIADDCLRDVYVRGKYRDVILPMLVLRRLDCLLEKTKKQVLEEVIFQEAELNAKNDGYDEDGLMATSGYVFYNTSQWTLSTLKAAESNNTSIMKNNIEEYLDGFSDNVKEIVKCFGLEALIKHMINKDVFGAVLDKFTSPYINLTPEIVKDPDGYKLPALTNLGMGYVFEELIRKFNEENNEEAGEHFTPREVIELMTHLVFDPIQNSLPTITSIYDPACGSGGMLTESQNFIKENYSAVNGQTVNRHIHLFGKEINDETYAICKSDMMIKDNNPENIKAGSTLSSDSFYGNRFDFMLSNPPYGKSWATEQKNIFDDGEVIDPRFKIKLKDYWQQETDAAATPRSSDGQLLFLMEMISKMKDPAVSGQGSRIASVHNGSSLFTGDAGSGESNIRRYIIENDMLDAIVQLPNNLFYNTGITTYIWLLDNNKLESRKGKVQLIDASLMFQKLRKNLGNKNCEFSKAHIASIVKNYLQLAEVERELDANQEPTGIASQVFNNEDFGYHKVNIERPDRRKAQFSATAIAPLRFDKALTEPMAYLYEAHGNKVYLTSGFGEDNKQSFLKSQDEQIKAWLEEKELKLSTKHKNNLLDVKFWSKLKERVELANQLMDAIGTEESSDFNHFQAQIDNHIKNNKLKVAATDKKAILNAVSWYDETAKKVIKKHNAKFKENELAELLERFECEQADLADFGYEVSADGKTYTSYESSSDLRDSESIPLKQSIYQYFLDEVKPHVDEAWLDLESVKIGYEISFNKYFYRHKPLRTLEEVASDIIALDQKAEGLIAQILGVSLTQVQK